MPLLIQTLLTRDDFRVKVFERDAHRCVVCHNTAADSHHILDRSLWDDGGYYLSNGVSLCPKHHVEAEKTLISCEKLREAAGIAEIIQPEHFYVDDKYDHWGNTVLPNGTRLKGELWGNENVQKILKEAGVENSFLKYIHYPRTYHCPWSENLQNDDRRHENNIALSWNETCEYANLLGLQVVPVLCRGIYSSIEELRNAIDTNIKGYSEVCTDEIEGYVIRLAGPIAYKDFRLSTAKAVRKHHVTTSEHWMSEKIIPNKIEV